MKYIDLETVRYVTPLDVQEYYWMLLDENDQVVQQTHERKIHLNLLFPAFQLPVLSITHWRKLFFIEKKMKRVTSVIKKYEKDYNKLRNDERYINDIISDQQYGKLRPTASEHHLCLRNGGWVCGSNGFCLHSMKCHKLKPPSIKLYKFWCAKCLNEYGPNSVECPQLSDKDLVKQEPTGIATCKHCTRLLCDNCIDCKACWFCKYEFENGIKEKPKKAKRKVIKKKAVVVNDDNDLFDLD
jgi:hypothetical protein